MSLLLGIDLGTSSVKAVLFDADDAVTLAVAGQEYPIHQPQPGYAEQNPDDWWQATVKVVRQVCADVSEVDGIGFSGLMHGPAFLDENNQSVHPSIIWADQRSAKLVQPQIDRVGTDDTVRLAGTLPAAGFMGPTLEWLKLHAPEVLDSVQRVVLPKDYVRLQMTGEVATDITDAAATGLFDIASGQWSDHLIGTIDVDRTLFPQVVASTDVVGKLTQEAADTLGLKAGIPIVAGSADQPAQAIANGIIRTGTASVTVGTGGQVCVPLYPNEDGTVPTDPRLHVFNHAVPQMYYVLGAILVAGLCLRWLRNTFGLEPNPDAYSLLSAEAAETPPGAEGLLFLPYLFGERTPHMDPLARGAFIGLTYRHNRGHMARAIMEGVTFALRQTLDISLSLVDEPVNEVIIAGGAAQSPVWRQIMTDILAREMPMSKLAEQSGIGAALMAGVGCGVFDDLDQANAWVAEYDTPLKPIQTHVSVYDELYAQYEALYDELCASFHYLSSM